MNSFALFARFLVVLTVLLLPGRSFGFWPFSSPREPYLAKVGEKVITTGEFVEAVNKLHTSNRVGKALAESHDKSFTKQNYRAFLDEMIDKKLIILDSESLGLDEGALFRSRYDTFRLNLFLERLRQEEVLDKVTVTDDEVKARFFERLRKAEEERRKKAEEEGEEEKEQPEETKTPEERFEALPAVEKGNIWREIYREKVSAREKEYFEAVKSKAQVVVYEENLEDISLDDPDLGERVVAEVDGDPIYAVELVNRDSVPGPEQMRRRLDALILHRALDHEALSRGYEEDEEVRKKLAAYREKLLVDIFKREIIRPLVVITDEEVKKFYEENKQRYRKPDEVDFRIIIVETEDEALSLLEELRKGADFAYLAKKRSIDSSAEKGGLMTSVPVNVFAREIYTLFYRSHKGDILGPFTLNGKYAIIKLLEMSKGEYVPVEKVRSSIVKRLGREKFDEQLNAYVARLREHVPIEINEDELKRISGE